MLSFYLVNRQLTPQKSIWILRRDSSLVKFPKIINQRLVIPSKNNSMSSLRSRPSWWKKGALCFIGHRMILSKVWGLRIRPGVFVGTQKNSSTLPLVGIWIHPLSCDKASNLSLCAPWFGYFLCNGSYSVYRSYVDKAFYSTNRRLEFHIQAWYIQGKSSFLHGWWFWNMSRHDGSNGKWVVSVS